MIGVTTQRSVAVAAGASAPAVQVSLDDVSLPTGGTSISHSDRPGGSASSLR